MRIKEESRDLQEPPAKRILIDEDVSLNMRMTPIGLPGANIKITSRGSSILTLIRQLASVPRDEFSAHFHPIFSQRADD